MRLIGQETPSQDVDWDYGPVEDLIVRTDLNVSGNKTPDPGHLEESSKESRQDSSDHPQHQQIEIAPQESVVQQKSINQRVINRKPRKSVGTIIRRSDIISAKSKSS